MKTIKSIVFLGLVSGFCFAQEPPVNDTLIPKQHKRDTIQYEPKLEGGALIDTINTKDKKFRSQPVHPDTLPKKPAHGKDSVEKKLGIAPKMSPVQPGQ